MGRARSLGKAALIVALLVVALVAGRESALLTRSTAQDSAAPTSTRAPGVHHDSPSVRGAISVLDDDRWTVTTVDGSPVTVTLSAQTVFGTANSPAQRSQFGVGTTIAVTGQRSGDTVTASRVIIPITHPSKPVAPTPPSTAAPVPSTPAPVTCAVSDGLDQALAYADDRNEQAAIAVYDTATGTYTAAGTPMPSTAPPVW